jgi:mRNA deadenylase 3'-5' endonuclease subunit Ccr4
MNATLLTAKPRGSYLYRTRTVALDCGSMSLLVATYNVLADAYVNRAWYRRTPALVPDPTWRILR